MGNMTKKLFLIPICLLTLAAAAMLFALPAPAARAAVLRADPVSAVFAGGNSGDFDAVGDAEIDGGTTGLLFNFPNEYAPHVTNTAHPLPSSAESFEIVTEFEVRDRGIGGRIGVGLGLLAPTGRLYQCGVMFDIGLTGDLYIRRQNEARSNNTSATDNMTGYNLAAGNMQGKRKVLKITGTRNADGTYDADVFVKSAGEADAGYVKYIKSGLDHTAEGVFCDGYFSLMSIGNTPGDPLHGLLVLVKSFSLQYADAGETVAYSTDFGGEADRISYPSNRNDALDWRLSDATANAPESAFFMGSCGKAVFGGADGYAQNGLLVGKDAVDEIDTRLDKVIGFKFTVKIQEIKEGAYFGLGLGLLGKASAVDESNMIYLRRQGSAYYSGVLADGARRDEAPVALAAAYVNGSSTVNIRYEVFYDTALKAYGVKEYLLANAGTNTLSDPVATFTDLKINGYYGFGAAGAGVRAEVYSASTFMYHYFVSGAGDDALDFLGTRVKQIAGETLQSPYYRASKWFMAGNTSGVAMPSDWNPNKYCDFNVPANTRAPFTAFGPKSMYGDFIFRYTIRDAETLPVTSPTAGLLSFIGLSFGRGSIEEAFATQVPAVAPGSPLIMFGKDPSGGMRVSWAALSARGYPAATKHYVDPSVNFFSGDGKAYDIMLLAQSGTATLFYCEAGTNDYTERVVFDNADTAGFIAVTGNSRWGYQYKVTKMSVNKCDVYDVPTGDKVTAANLSDRQLNDVAQHDFAAAYINDTRFSVGEGIFVQNGALRFADTAREARFETKGQFDNFLLSFDLTQKFQNTDLILTFGKSAENPHGYSIKFLAGTDKIETAGMMIRASRDTVGRLPINIYEYAGTLNFRLMCFNNTVRLYIKRGDEPAAMLGLLQAEFAYLRHGYRQNAGTVAIGTSEGGNMSIDNFRTLSLNFGIDIITTNYGETGLPPLTDLTKLPPTEGHDTGLLIGLSVGGFVLLAGGGAAVYFLLIKKRKGGQARR
ncbi:MAG: hypothetical protein LBH24_00460 [Clostridiales bacterium]|jgi:hypothetical protein|nr:hypothetical protein [Clostridiales bacterium]